MLDSRKKRLISIFPISYLEISMHDMQFMAIVDGRDDLAEILLCKGLGNRLEIVENESAFLWNLFKLTNLNQSMAKAAEGVISNLYETHL